MTAVDYLAYLNEKRAVSGRCSFFGGKQLFYLYAHNLRGCNLLCLF